MDSLDQIKRWIVDAIRVHMARDHRRLVTGHVTAVDTTAKRCTVTIGGNSFVAAYAIDLSIAVNDDVYIDKTDSSYVAIGRAKLVAP